MNGNIRENLKPGARVLIVQKQDQHTGKMTEGVVESILTSAATHPHGIKVRLIGGLVGRVKKIIP
ncbi:YwbE family protein [Candidatus Contubernalis alkaliaceticus]|uniref:YwbE family protein n=1 Tax=Candidatus Contubernalis alkaliaceticus TaxID=338645 RepID=UPI001F4C04BE|nr:YwbE family protein [Candidatus Contubernalis alkalaceticus]UNC92186.1 YwbE family protein [Candidatus Contubernalis alkalaceticus]